MAATAIQAPPAVGDSEKWATQERVDYTSVSANDSGQGFDGQARVYTWDEEFGDVGPKFGELELELFGPMETRKEKRGLDFSK